METVGNFIHGKTTLSSSGVRLPVTNPATGKVIRQVTHNLRGDAGAPKACNMRLFRHGVK